MSSLKVTDGMATVWFTLSAQFTNEETEPVLETKQVRVSRDHPLLVALLDTAGHHRQLVRADHPGQSAAVLAVKGHLEHLLDGIVDESPGT